MVEIEGPFVSLSSEDLNRLSAEDLEALSRMSSGEVIDSLGAVKSGLQVGTIAELKGIEVKEKDDWGAGGCAI